MSLRYAGRVFYQAGMRMMQGMKDQASKCESNLRSLKDSASSASSSSSSKQSWRFSNSLDSGAFKAAKNERLKQAEESLRTVIPRKLQKLTNTKARFSPGKLYIIRGCSSQGEGEKKTERRSFLTLEEAGLVEISGLSTHERFLCRLTISSLNLLRVISEQEGCSIEELNAGRVTRFIIRNGSSDHGLGS
ncbi:Uncharacterized protein TCM_030007 [Theobroma cacao]|uniref:Uncharacterized protein n=1 Tax=Theobroma cacao TaxID=3641 RepID=A0A061GFU0_THECC|nr:Uncharacterized protein TCM_030007 [Theobroma cacao]